MLLPENERMKHFRAGAGLLMALSLTLCAAAAPDPAYYRDRIDAGYQLDQLAGQAGTGADPGPADPQARLRWAIATAVPSAWSERVPVAWSIKENGRLGLSFPDGRVELSPQLLRRSAQTLLTTVAHEMGHQVAIALAPGGDGSPPQGFVELLPGNPYVRFDEGWADCVSRVWTGSLEHTTGERNACPVDAARYVSVMLSDPENFKVQVRVTPSTWPSPSSAASPSPAPGTNGPKAPNQGPSSIGAFVLLGGALAGAAVVRGKRKRI